MAAIITGTAFENRTLTLAAEDKNHCINAISFLEFGRITGQHKSGDLSDVEAECRVERPCSLCITAAWHSDYKIGIAFPRLLWHPVKGDAAHSFSILIYFTV